MPDSIDSLQIEIMGSAGAAVKGIDALTASLEKLKSIAKGGAGLTAVTNQLKKLSETMSGINNSGLAKLSALAESLKPFSQLEKPRLTSYLTQLKKLPEVAKGLENANMDKFASSIERVTAAMKPLAREMDAISRGFSALPTKLQRVIHSNERLAASNSKTGDSFQAVGTGATFASIKLGGFYFAVRQAAQVVSGWLTKSTEYIENLNLFRVAMGEYAEAAEEYAYKVENLMGIDPSEWMRNQGVFMTLATGFGVAGDKAAYMSQELTELGYDISSFFNIDIEDAMQKLQSGISGELEPLRRLGYDLSQAKLQRIADDFGIEKKLSKMDQAEKSLLRYYAIMTQVTTAQGDMALTLQSPANQLRIFKANLDKLCRSLGNLFIPLLNYALPPLIALAQVLREIINSIAKLFGFELPELDTGGFGTAAGDAGDLSGALDDAAESAKKAKKYLMGFDELNIYTPPAEEKSAGGGSGGFDPGFQNIFDNLPGDDFLKGLQENVDMLKGKIEDLLPVIATVAAGLLAWKVGPALFSGLQTLPSLIKGADDSALLFTITLATITARLTYLITKSERFQDGIKAIVEGFKNFGIWIENAALPAVEAFFDSFVPAEVQDFFAPMGQVLDDFDMDLADLGITAAGILMMATGVGAPLGAALVGFEAITLAIRDIGYWTSPCIEEMDLFGGSISEVTKAKVEPFVEKLQELDNTMKNITWGHQLIDDSVLEDVQNKVSAVTEIILNELSSDRNEVLGDLDPLKNSLGEARFNEILAASDSYYMQQEEKVRQGETRINEIMAEAAAAGGELTLQQQQEISRIMGDMQTQGIEALSETELESRVIMRRMADNNTAISLEQASEIIKNAKSTRDEATQAAWEQYAKIEWEAKRMLDVGTINQGQYDAIMAAANETRHSTINDANEQYDQIEKTVNSKLGDTAKYIDSETGDIRSKWSVFCEDLSTGTSSMMSDIKQWWDDGWADTMLIWEDFSKNFKNTWYGFWEGVANFFIRAWNGIVSGAESGINYLIDGLNVLLGFGDKVAEFFGFTTSTSLGYVHFARVPEISLPRFAKGNVAKSPTVAVFGEYAGAQGNPEITAPQSIIYDTVVSANSGLVSVMYQIAGQIMTTIEDNQPVLEGDMKKVFRIMRRESAEYRRVTGKPAF